MCMWHLLTWSLTHVITQQLEVFIVGIKIVTRTYNKFVCFKPSAKMASH